MKLFREFLDHIKKLFHSRQDTILVQREDENLKLDELKYFAVVQFEHANFRSAKELQNKIREIVREAILSSHVQFILFPAGMNLELYSTSQDSLSDNQISRMSDECLKVFSNVASAEKVFIAYADLVRGKKIFHILNSNGKVIVEDPMIVMGIKITFFESSGDIDLFLAPSFTKKWIGDYESFAHAWLYSQQECVYTMEAYMVGDHYTGQSGIYAPIEATDALNGIIKQAQSKNFGEILIAELDFSKIKEARSKNSEYDRLFANK